jgi:hypothetical protein
MNRTRPVKALLAVTLCVALLGGCRKKQGEDEAIRAAIRQHLVSLNTLNLQAMDMEFAKVAIQGNQASAEVTFKPKTGAPAGAAMQVSYRLEKVNGNWAVVKTAAAGGVIDHPDPGKNPHTQTAPGDVHGNLPNFKDVLGAPGEGAKGALPPGHPPVSTPTPAPKSPQ